MIVKVAWLSNVIPNYRLPFLTRLAQRREIEIVCLHGESKKGFTAESVGKNLPVEGVWVQNYYWPLGGKRLIWQTAVLPIIKGNFDVVICIESVHNLTTWVLWSLRKLFGFRFVLIGYGYRPQQTSVFVAKVRDLARMLLLRSADAILVYTREGKEACVAAGLEADKIFVSYNTLDTEKLAALSQKVTEADLAELCSEYGLHDRAVLLFVGKIVAEKRLDVLLDAVRELNSKGERVSLLIIGDGHERKVLEEKAKDITDVFFLGAIYDELELARYFELAELLVIPGRVGLTCVHGFSHGVPVVTSKGGVEQSPEFAYIVHGENGILLDTPSPHLYATEILAVLRDEQRLNDLKVGAFKAASSLGMQPMVEEFVKAVNHAMLEKPQNRAR